MKKLNLNAIRIDGGTQPRERIDMEAVGDYSEAIKVGIEFPPVIVFYDGAEHWLADGFHRWHAHKQAEKASILVDVRAGSLDDAKLFASGCNGDHGLRRTNADKRLAVLMALGVKKDWTDTKLAAHCAVSVPFVSAIRRPEVAVKQQEHRALSAAKSAPDRNPITPIKTVGESKPPAAPRVAAPSPADDGMVTQDELLSQMQETQSENEQLHERVSLLTQDDKAAEIDKLLTRVHGLEGRLQQAMNQIHASEETTKYHAALIHKLRKLLGVEGHKEIYNAVKALVSESAEA